MTVSIESAITSRDTSEYFIPSVPIEMPSEMVATPNNIGMPPAVLMASNAALDKSSRMMLQGVRLLYPLAIPTMGLLKSASVNPTARNMERFGVR